MLECRSKSTEDLAGIPKVAGTGRSGECSTFRRKGDTEAPKWTIWARCICRATVEVGRFSKAAIATNTKTSTVSRAIASLEEDLGVGLFIAPRAARISPSREPHSTSTHAALSGAWRNAGCCLGNGRATAGIDPPACPERLCPPAYHAVRARLPGNLSRYSSRYLVKRCASRSAGGRRRPWRSVSVR